MDYILSEKRHRIIRMIDRLGVVTAQQLERLFPEYGASTILRSRHQAEDMGFIETMAFGRQKVLRITRQGSQYFASLNKEGRDSYSTLHHDLVAVSVLEAFLAKPKFRDGTYALRTERELFEDYALRLSMQRKDSGQSMKRLSRLVPDFTLYNEEEQIAFEVELSRKTSQALETKMKHYKEHINDGTYQGVVYVVREDAIRRHVEHRAAEQGIHALETHVLTDIIPGEGV